MVGVAKRMEAHEALVGYKVRHWGRWRLVKAVTVDEKGKAKLVFGDGRKPAPRQQDLGI